MGKISLQPETSLSSCRKNGFSFIALFFLILIIYSNTFHASWHFDDQNNILTNKALHIAELSSGELKKTFFASYDGKKKLFRPVACFTFALNYYFAGNNTFDYHVVNLLIHFLASIFLFLFIHNTLNLLPLKEKYGANSYSIALLAAVLWSINPVQTQAVTYIVQRMTSLAAMFYIMSMYFYLKARISSLMRSKLTLYFISFLSGILAFGSKENTILLPISIFLFDLSLIQGLRGLNIKKNIFALLSMVLMIFIVALALKGPSILEPTQLISGYLNRPFTLVERLLTESRVIIFYISLLLYPMPNRLCLCHDFTISQGLFDPFITCFAILTILIIFLSAIINAKKIPFISYCIIFFLLNHIVESSILPLEIIFEHRNYLPSMLCFAPLSILIIKGIELFNYKQSMRTVSIFFVIMVLVILGHSTFIRNATWKTEKSLWLDCIEKYPDLWRPFHNLGKYYSDIGQKKQAINNYEEALNKKIINHPPQHRFITFFNLGVEYFKMGHFQKALHYYQKADAFHPKFGPLQNNMGIILLKLGMYEKAETKFRKAIEYSPNLMTALNNLGLILIIKGDMQEAIVILKKALLNDSTNNLALVRISRAYLELNKYYNALMYIKKTIQNNPSNHLGRLILAEIYYAGGNKKQAGAAIDSLVNSIDPNQLCCLVNKFLGSGNPDVLLVKKNRVFPLLHNAFHKKNRYQNLSKKCLDKLSLY